MQKIIYKYTIHHEGDAPDVAAVGPGNPFAIQMPISAEVMTVQFQHGCGCIWALCDPNYLEAEPRKFILALTGAEFDLPESATYVGTFQINPVGIKGWVGHLFELKT